MYLLTVYLGKIDAIRAKIQTTRPPYTWYGIVQHAIWERHLQMKPQFKYQDMAPCMHHMAVNSTYATVLIAKTTHHGQQLEVVISEKSPEDVQIMFALKQTPIVAHQDTTEPQLTAPLGAIVVLYIMDITEVLTQEQHQYLDAINLQTGLFPIPVELLFIHKIVIINNFKTAFSGGSFY